MSGEKSKGIWAAHFHWQVLLKWEVLGWIIGIVLAVAALLLVFDQYFGANVCFIVLAAFLLGKVAHEAVLAVDPVWHRFLFTLVLFGIIGVGVVAAVMGVNRWKAHHELPKVADQSITRQLDKPSLSLNCDVVLLPVPYHGEIWFLLPSSKLLGKLMANPLKPDGFWPSEGFVGSLGQRCSVTNYESQAIFGLTLPFQATHRIAVKRDDGRTNAGAVSETSTLTAAIPRPLGPQETLTFYMGNLDPDKFLEIKPPSSATVDVGGRQATVPVKLYSTMGETLALGPSREVQPSGNPQSKLGLSVRPSLSLTPHLSVQSGLAMYELFDILEHHRGFVVTVTNDQLRLATVASNIKATGHFRHILGRTFTVELPWITEQMVDSRVHPSLARTVDLGMSETQRVLLFYRNEDMPKVKFTPAMYPVGEYKGPDLEPGEWHIDLTLSTDKIVEKHSIALSLGTNGNVAGVEPTF